MSTCAYCGKVGTIDEVNDCICPEWERAHQLNLRATRS